MASAWSRQSLRLMLLLLAFGLLMYNAQAQSPTMDEQNHMARGYALLRTGDPRLSLEHPPLINLLEAVPLGGEIVDIVPCASTKHLRVILIANATGLARRPVLIGNGVT